MRICEEWPWPNNTNIMIKNIPENGNFWCYLTGQGNFRLMQCFVLTRRSDAFGPVSPSGRQARLSQGSSASGHVNRGKSGVSSKSRSQTYRQAGSPERPFRCFDLQGFTCATSQIPQNMCWYYSKYETYFFQSLRSCSGNYSCAKLWVQINVNEHIPMEILCT